MLSYRLLHEVSIFKFRSFCPRCRKNIRWYDLVPIFSWLILSGKCRFCKKNISILYPIIELLTLIIFTLLYVTLGLISPEKYLISYAFFFSALIITIRSDLELFLISRYVTLYIIPVAFILSYLNFLPISLIESIIGSILGYGILWIIAKTFYIYTGKHGMGQGDLELLAMIGSFTGILGAWVALCLGSILGSFVGIFILLINKQKRDTIVLPFGPFLSIGAIIYVLFTPSILKLIYIF